MNVTLHIDSPVWLLIYTLSVLVYLGAWTIIVLLYGRYRGEKKAEAKFNQQIKEATVRLKVSNERLAAAVASQK